MKHSYSLRALSTAKLKGHYDPQDSHPDKATGQHQGENGGGNQRIIDNDDTGQHIEDSNKHMQDDALPTLAFKGLKELNAATYEQENTEEQHAGYGKSKEHAQSNNAKNNKKDTQGQQPTSVLLYLTEQGIGIHGYRGLIVLGHKRFSCNRGRTPMTF